MNETLQVEQSLSSGSKIANVCKIQSDWLAQVMFTRYSIHIYTSVYNFIHRDQLDVNEKTLIQFSSLI